MITTSLSWHTDNKLLLIGAPCLDGLMLQKGHFDSGLFVGTHALGRVLARVIRILAEIDNIPIMHIHRELSERSLLRFRKVDAAC